MILWPGGDIPDKAKPQKVRLNVEVVVSLKSTWMMGSGSDECRYRHEEWCSEVWANEHSGYWRTCPSTV